MAPAEPQPAATPVYTIGHSTRPLADFIALLREAGVTCLVDVRKLPGSRAFPQFNAEPLAAALTTAGISSWRLPALCGRRSAREVRDLPAVPFWRNASFGRYAAWAGGAPFREALDALVARAARERCVLMCAEAVWWRCHRRIITDHLLARGVVVRHILGPGQVRAASLTPGARVERGRVIYPSPAPGAGEKTPP